jgi:magnesium transporter
MLEFYRIAAHHLTALEPSADADVVLTANPTKEEQEQLCRLFDLDPLTFAFCNSAEEVSRFHFISSTIIEDAAVLVLYDFIGHYDTIEQQLAPAIIIFNQSCLIICTEAITACRQLLIKAINEDGAILDIVFSCINLWQDRLLRALLGYKKQIDQLDAAASQTVKNTELREMTDLTRKLVFFEHTMNDQSDTLAAFFSTPQLQSFSHKVIDNTKTRQRRLTKTIHIYRDLLSSIGSLFTAMMDNNLNHLMKYLDSAGLVIAVIALVTGFMGMNVGGLPWKASTNGFILTCIVALILATATGIYLKRKSFSD